MNPYKTQLIKQRTAHDCAIACMAMLIGKSWEDTNAVIGHLVDYDGDRPGMRDEQEALRLLGFSGEFQRKHTQNSLNCYRMR